MMSIQALEQRYQRKWATIGQATEDANQELAKLKELLTKEERSLGSLDSEDISIVVFGSLARGEWTSGSDLD